MVQPEFKPFNIFVTDADRFHVYDGDREFIDFSGSAMTTGYNFIKSNWLSPQVSRLVFENVYTRKLTESLLSISGYSQVAFATSGTEACDTALARFGKPIFSLEGAYHGLTYLTRKASNGTGYDRAENIIHLKCPNSDVSIDEAIQYNSHLIKTERINAEGGTMILELIQSDGGVNVLPQDFVKYLFDLASDLSLHTIVDEVYTGYGRSGEMFLSRKYGISPDMICLGKGMAAGLPLGAILYNEEWNLPYNQVVSMQAGNMFVSRVATEVLRALNKSRLKFVRRKGEEIIKKLSEVRNPHVWNVRGRGFMIGVEFRSNNSPDGKYALEIRRRLSENGVICSLTGEFNNVLKITPPVLIDEQTVNRGVDSIIEVINTA